MDFWRFARMLDGNGAALYVEGEIWAEIPWYLEDGTVAAPDSFRRQLDQVYNEPLTVYVNSPGGDAAAGVAMCTLLRQRQQPTTCIVLGMAYSAASLIPCGCSKVLMSPGALMMIHNPSVSAYGDHRDLERAKQYLENLKTAVLALYREKSGQTDEAISQMMDDEVFMTAQRAVDLGFADEILAKPGQEPNASRMLGYQAAMSLNRSSTQKSMEWALQAQQTNERAQMMDWLKTV